MTALGIIAVYAAYLAGLRLACILASRFDARADALDEHAEFLGAAGAGSFFHGTEQ